MKRTWIAALIVGALILASIMTVYLLKSAEPEVIRGLDVEP